MPMVARRPDPPSRVMSVLLMTIPTAFVFRVVVGVAVLMMALGMGCMEDRLRALEHEMVSVCYGGVQIR